MVFQIFVMNVEDAKDVTKNCIIDYCAQNQYFNTDTFSTVTLITFEYSFKVQKNTYYFIKAIIYLENK